MNLRLWFASVVAGLALGVVLAVAFPKPVHAAACPPALVWATGNTLTATALNTNPNAFSQCFLNIDNTNIGAAGIFASQIIGTTTAQATFGGAGNYRFPGSVYVRANAVAMGNTGDANMIQYVTARCVSTDPREASLGYNMSFALNVLTIIGAYPDVCGTQPRILRVMDQIDIGTSAATCLGVGQTCVSAGISNFGGAITASGTVTGTGLLTAGDLSARNGVFYVGSNAAVITMPTAVASGVYLSFNTQAVAGYCTGSTNWTMNSAALVGTIPASSYGVRCGSNYILTQDLAGDMGIPGTLHQASSRKSKRAIGPLQFDPLDAITKTAWVQYCYKQDAHCNPWTPGSQNVGYIGEDTTPYLSGPHHNSVAPATLAAVDGAAIQELARQVKELEQENLELRTRVLQDEAGELPHVH